MIDEIVPGQFSVAAQQIHRHHIAAGAKIVLYSAKSSRREISFPIIPIQSIIGDFHRLNCIRSTELARDRKASRINPAGVNCYFLHKFKFIFLFLQAELIMQLLHAYHIMHGSRHFNFGHPQSKKGCPRSAVVAVYTLTRTHTQK